MSRSPTTSRMPRRLRRRPLLLTAAIVAVNRVHRFRARRRAAAWAIVTVLGALLVVMLAFGGWAGAAIHATLRHREVVVAVSALYAASLISSRWRSAEAARAHSWLIATTLVHGEWAATARLLTVLALLWRLAAAAALIALASLNPEVTIRQTLTLSGLMSLGGLIGAPIGWWLARRAKPRRKASSRYTPRPKTAGVPGLSSSALSRWPIVQALAWGRPENARMLLAAAILTVPGGTPVLGAVLMLAAWVAVSYLAAVFVAVPYVARSASAWLRSTPISFWGFAWPIARRAFLHQVCGTLLGMGVMVMAGSPPSSAMYLGTLWMTVVVLTAALSLADGYRARSSTVRPSLSVLATLLAEELAHGLGISLALLLTALHLRAGARHGRA